MGSFTMNKSYQFLLYLHGFFFWAILCERSDFFLGLQDLFKAFQNLSMPKFLDSILNNCVHSHRRVSKMTFGVNHKQPWTLRGSPAY